MLILLAILAVLALIAWPLFGPAHALLLCCAMLGVAWWRESMELKRLSAWLLAPTPESVPEAPDRWMELYLRFSRILRNRQKQESSLSEALQRFQLAGAAVPDGLVILGEEHEIEWCNPAAEKHLGIELKRDAGHQISYILRAPSFVDYLAAENHPEPLVLRFARDIDRPAVVSIQIVPFGDRQRMVISRDIARIEAVETLRRDFVANVSHELRTPLTVVIGFLETVLDMKDVPGSAARPLQMVMEQAQRMQRLVDDLLVLSRLESADNPPSDQPVDIAALARKLHEDAMALSGGRHRVQLSLDSAQWARGNADELTSAFTNLVTNAIRYTPEGGEIALRWGTREGEGRFEVRDTGIGIEAPHLPRLTERFYRVDRSRSRETGGTGLGLAIVKHVATRHGARLDIRSEPGVGSRFAIVFPAARLVSAPEHPAEDKAA